MVAHGMRMMTQGLFFPHSIYPAPVPTSFDFWFDWFTLCVLGCIIVYIGATRWVQLVHRKKSTESTEKQSFIMPT